MNAEDVESTIDSFREAAGDRAAQVLASLIAFGPNIAVLIEPDERVRNTALTAYELFQSGMAFPSRDQVIEELKNDGWHEFGDECREFVEEDGWHAYGQDCLDHAGSEYWHSEDDCEEKMEGSGWCPPSWSMREVVKERLGNDGVMLIDDALNAMEELHKSHDKFSAQHCPLCQPIYELINAF